MRGQLNEVSHSFELRKRKAHMPYETLEKTPEIENRSIRSPKTSVRATIRGLRSAKIERCDATNQMTSRWSVTTRSLGGGPVLTSTARPTANGAIDING